MHSHKSLGALSQFIWCIVTIGLGCGRRSGCTVRRMHQPYTFSLFLAIHSRFSRLQTQTLEYYSGYTAQQLQECASHILSLQRSGSNQLPAIREKYRQIQVCCSIAVTTYGSVMWGPNLWLGTTLLLGAAHPGLKWQHATVVDALFGAVCSCSILLYSTLCPWGGSRDGVGCRKGQAVDCRTFKTGTLCDVMACSFRRWQRYSL